MGATTKINDVINIAMRRQSRRNTEIENLVRASLKEYIKEEICTIFPFWFLRVEPGGGFLSQEFPMSQDDLENAAHVNIPGFPNVDYWMDRGILRLKEGQSEYELFAPAETPVGDRVGAYWVGAKFQKPKYCKLISTKGTIGPEIPITHSQVFLQNQVPCVPGPPQMLHLESGRERDIVRVTPTPDKAYTLALSWILAEPLNYYLDPEDVATENWTNKFIQEHEELWVYFAMLKIAEYFQDLPNIEFYKKEIFGEANRGVGITGGKIGDLKRSNQRKNIQDGYTIGTYKTNPMKSRPNARDPWNRW